MPRSARYAVGRGIEYLSVLALALVINFVLPRALPGGPLKTLGGGENVGVLSTEDQQRILAEYGLDKSLGEQFLTYLANLLTLDLGKSFADGQPVLDVIVEALPWTMLLVGSSIVLTFLIGVTLGAFGGLRRKQGKGSGLLASALLFDSIPSFWLGMVLIAVFGAFLGLLPTFGVGEGWDDPAGLPRHLLLPVATLTLTGLGQFFLVTRSSMLAVLSSDHIEHARARGVPRARLVRKHALRTALLPVHTVLMIEVGFLVGGALVVETVFAYPGLGRVTFNAIQARDFPLMQATFLVLTVAVVVMNAVADATYALIDPRIRTGAAS
ncbi:ABC transporter permease [Actinopolymorpha alba]|uniref:ABC transporter permease n=1 Tax=Actinopolymorpha alba TaxID=533267 RepID=UPI00037B4BA6|nr:ABC transporter permease [Actinopolymorpha alba]